MTETGRLIADCHEPRQIHTRAFGRPANGFRARVVDDHDADVPPGTEGEPLVRWDGPEGPRHAFFAGYLKNGEAAADAALARALVAWCLDRLAYFKAPGFILFAPSLPTTGTQKVQKTRSSPAARTPAAAPTRSTSARSRSEAEPTAQALEKLGRTLRRQRHPAGLGG